MIALGFYEGVSTLSKIIRWETRSYISHVSVMQLPDFVIGDIGQVRMHVIGHALTTCPVWEAWGSVRHPVKGSGVFKRTGINDGHTPGTKLHIYQIDPMVVGKLHEQAVVDYLNDVVEQGTKYDWMGLVRFMFRVDRDNSKAVFCSELAQMAMLEGGVPLLHRVEPYRVAPADLYRSPLLKLLISAKTGNALECPRNASSRKTAIDPQKTAGQTCRVLQSQIRAVLSSLAEPIAPWRYQDAVTAERSGINPTDNSNSNLTPALAHGTMVAC